MRLKGKRQSGNVEDRRDGTGNNEVRSAYSSFSNATDNVNYNNSKGSASDSQMAKDAGANSMEAAASRDRTKTRMQGRTRWAGEQTSNVPRQGGQVIEKIGIPTSDGTTKDRLK